MRRGGWIWVLTLAASPATTPSGVAAAPLRRRKITAARFSGTGFTPTPQREAYRFAAEHAPRRTPHHPAEADLTSCAAPLPAAASSFSATVPPWILRCPPAALKTSPAA